MERTLRQRNTARHLIWHYTKTLRTESLGLWNHAPKNLRQHVLARECWVVAHGDKPYRVSMDGSLIATAKLYPCQFLFLRRFALQYTYSNYS